MTTFLARSVWTSTPRPTALLARMDADTVRGVAVHYTGSTARLGNTATLDVTCRRLEQERQFHTDPEPRGRAWSDIAYGWAIDQEGRALEARGHLFKSAANGSSVTNSGYGAVTFLIGVGDVPTPAAAQAFRDWRARVWLRAFPRGTEVVGHRDLFSTECPGDPLYSLVRLGTLAGSAPSPGNDEEDDMPLTDTDVLKILNHPRFVTAVREAVWAARWPLASGAGAPTEQADIRLWRASHPEAAAAEIAEAVVNRIGATVMLGQGVTVKDIADAVRKELGK